MFSIFGIDLTKITSINLNESIGTIIKPFDSSEGVDLISTNILDQMGSTEMMRGQLEGLQNSISQATTAADFNSVSNYMTSLQQMTDTSCLLATTKSSLIPMSFDSIATDSSFLSSMSKGFQGGNFGESLTEIIPSEIDFDLADAAVIAANAYGIPLDHDTAAFVLDQTPIKNQTLASVGLDYSSGNIDVSTCFGSISTDSTGGLMEASFLRELPATMESFSPTDLANITPDQITNLASGISDYHNPDGITGMLGGMNFANPDALSLGLEFAGYTTALESGNLDGAMNFATQLLDSNQPPDMLFNELTNYCDSFIQTPGNIEKFTNIYDTLQDQLNAQNPLYDLTSDLSSTYDFISSVEHPEDILMEREQLIQNLANRAMYETETHEFLNQSIEILKSGINTSTSIAEELNNYPLIDTQNLPYVPEAMSLYKTPEGFTAQDATGEVWSVACNLGEKLLDSETPTGLAAESLNTVIRDVTSVIEKDRISNTMNNAVDLTDNVLSSGGKLAEKIYGKEVARKASALQDIASNLKKAKTFSNNINQLNIY